jgi:hypothetical protein
MTIFYFKNFELGKVLFCLVKVWNDLNWIWIHWNLNLNRNKPPLPGLGPTRQRPPPLLFRRQSCTHAMLVWSHRDSATTSPRPPRGCPHRLPPPLSPPRVFKGTPHRHRRSFSSPLPPFSSSSEPRAPPPLPIASCPPPAVIASPQSLPSVTHASEPLFHHSLCASPSPSPLVL